LDFESAKPSIVKSIRQRDLLNTWLRLYARHPRLHRVEYYRPERLTEELPDLVYCAADIACDPARLTILTARAYHARTVVPAAGGRSTTISGRVSRRS
jgi:hypothetical protein